MWIRALIRPAQAILIVLMGGCLVSIVGLGLLVVQGRARLDTMRERVEHTNHLLRLGLNAQQRLLEHPADREIVDPVIIDDLQKELSELRASGPPLEPANEVRLGQLSDMLNSDVALSRDRLIDVVTLMGDVLRSESTAQSALWSEVEMGARRELLLTAGLFGLLPLVAVLTWWIRRRFIAAPLDDLRRLLTQLGNASRHEVPVETVHPTLVPLFANYNQLVRRLDELEAAHRTHASNLEADIRSAVATLLEQQTTLAHTERLAAVGETTASLAHELRNPLSGILMSLGNLRRDTDNADFAERLDLVTAEIERLTRLLNQSLAAARHRPEPSRQVNLRELVNRLLALLRYQIPDHISLECTIDEDLLCSLPEDRLRQALLNLILNSAEAVGETTARIIVTAKLIDGRLEVAVSDDGPGFPNQLLEGGIRAFTSGSGNGTGLGLAMVRRLATDLGGEVQLSNTAPHGACVRLTMRCGHV